MQHRANLEARSMLQVYSSMKQADADVVVAMSHAVPSVSPCCSCLCDGNIVVYIGKLVKKIVIFSKILRFSQNDNFTTY